MFLYMNKNKFLLYLFGSNLSPVLLQFYYSLPVVLFSFMTLDNIKIAKILI